VIGEITAGGLLSRHTVPHFSLLLREVGLPFSHSKQLNSLIHSGGAQLLIQRGQRDFSANSDLQVCSVVNRKPVALGEM
jgi:hypothetical protein